MDVGHESIAIHEAKKLGIPVVAVVDTNCSPDGVEYVIPGNDDAMRAIQLYAVGIADAVLEGKESGPVRAGGRGRVRRARRAGQPAQEVGSWPSAAGSRRAQEAAASRRRPGPVRTPVPGEVVVPAAPVVAGVSSTRSTRRKTPSKQWPPRSWCLLPRRPARRAARAAMTVARRRDGGR